MKDQVLVPRNGVATVSYLLEVDGIKRVYPEFDLEAGFGVCTGEFFSLLGPSGSGKTTLLRLIAGFDRPGRGRIVLDGRDITNLPPHRRRIGMVFQDYALFPHLTVGENVGYGLKVRGIPAPARRDRVLELLALTGLAGFQARLPASLSGGEKQRVAVARALAPEPLILLLDEPFSALDLALRKRLRREIHELQRRAGLTILFVTHSQEEASALSDRMLVMSTGRIEQVGTPAEIYRSPASAFVANFFGEMNRLPVLVAPDGRSLILDGRSFTCPPGKTWPEGPGWLYFRPEEGSLSRRMEEGPVLPTKVRGVEFTGATTTIKIAGRDWIADVLALSGGSPAFAPGDQAWLRLPLQTVQIFAS